MSTYPPPVDRLLGLGETQLGVEWPDYRAMGIGPEHVPELVRLATDAELILKADEEGEDEAPGWACEHALRAIGQLGAVEAVAPLLDGLDRMADLHDFWVEDLAEVMAVLGPEALTALERYFGNVAHDDRHRTVVCESFVKVAQTHPEARERVVSFLGRQLAEPGNAPGLNGFIVAALIDLEAVEAAPAIERAFEADRVDPAIAGDWPLVKHELGLGPLPERRHYLKPLAPGRPAEPSGPRRPSLRAMKEKRKRARKQSKKRDR